MRLAPDIAAIEHGLGTNDRKDDYRHRCRHDQKRSCVLEADGVAPRTHPDADRTVNHARSLRGWRGR